MNRIWTGGYDAFAEAVRAEYVSQRRELKRRMREAATLAEREQAAEELRQLGAAYRQRLAEGRRSLF